MRALLAVTALTFAMVGLARAEETVPARLVVDASGSGDPAAFLEQLRDAFGDAFEARVVGVESALDYGFGPWAVSSPATLQQCSAEPLSGAELDAAIAEIESLMLALEYGDATARLAMLESRLCAATDPLSPDTASRVPFLLGICRFYAGDEESARAAFLRAVERRPELEWDPDFPPAPQQVFLKALGAAIRSPRTVLELGERPLKLWIDGIEIPGDAADVALVGTRHLLQASRGDGHVATLELHTGEADRVALLGPRQALAGLLESPETEDGEIAFGRLVVAAHRLGHAEVIVMQSPRPDLAWRYNDVERRWSKVSLVLGHQLAQARKTRTAGGMMMGVGATLAFTGAAIGATSHAHGKALLDDMEQDAGMYDMLIDEFEAHQRGTAIGFGVMAVGSALVAVGIPFLIQAARVEKGALEDARLTVLPSDGGVYVALSVQH